MAIDYGMAVLEVRTAKNMTQRQLAAAAGLNPSYISVIEGNQRRMTTDTLTAVAKALGVPVWALVVIGSDDAPDAVRGAAMAVLTKDKAPETSPCCHAPILWKQIGGMRTYRTLPNGDEVFDCKCSTCRQPFMLRRKDR
jgi:transcriptional regulator with XRE-family HTH domain